MLILSGDHIYKMNYEEMLDFHREKGADVTISVIEVPWDEASRFGIMNASDDMSITEFEEKPAYPKSNLASMGIYIFNWKVLKEYLIKDNERPDSSHDFGKDIIPCLLEEGKKLFAYPFKGYWKDVGTVRSLWEANMDLLDEKCELNLYDPSWRIYSVNPNQPPQYISPQASVLGSLINEGCTVEGDVERSVIFQGVTIEAGAVVRESVIMPEAVIGRNAYIEKAIIPGGITIPDGAVIRGNDDPEGVILVSEEMLDDLKIQTETTLKKKIG